MIQRVVVPGALTALINLAVFGLLIGWGGASRAISVGPDTLFRDHLGAVTVAAVTAGLLAGNAGWRLASGWHVSYLLLVVVATDLMAAVGAVSLIPELQILDVPLALAAETALGTQLIAVAFGGFLGHWLRAKRTPAA